MVERRRRWVPIAIGVAFILVCIVIGLAVVATSVFRENVDVKTTDAAAATTAFDDIRRRFGERPPLLEIRDGRPHRVSTAQRGASSTVALERMMILAWDPDDNHLARVTLPFWLLRMKATPINFGSYAADIDDGEMPDLRVEDLEAHGPGIVLEHASPAGQRVLVWLE